MGQLSESNHVPAIEVSGLSFAYNGTLVLDNVNLTFETGRLSIILGRNGSGKSTFLRLISGLLPCQTGLVKLFGNNTQSLSLKEKARDMAFLAQQYKAVFPFKVSDVVLTGRAGFVPYLPSAADKRIACEALERVGAIHLNERVFTELSGGEQQLVLIARTLAQQPRILLLDEPISHLDYNHQLEILQLLKQLAHEGMAVITILHDPNLAFLYGDDFVFAHDKQLTRADKEKVWESPWIKKIYIANMASIAYGNKGLVVPILN